MTPAGACPNCLRRSWLLSLIAPYIENALDHDNGELPFDLLRLDNATLVEAVAPKVAPTLLARVDALHEGYFADALRAVESWATCRHDPFYPASLHELPAAPSALIGLGDPGLLVGFDWSQTVTIVGARRATTYGREMSRALGADLAANDVTVVSGMDFGIDSSALRGAVDHAGRSIAVLPCSADIAYPASMRSLWRRIKESGLILSEFAPKTPPWKWSISARNRIMAGLAGVTVVVEARKDSGSLVTAELARNLGNEVGAVPGQATSLCSVGTNALLTNSAQVVRGAEDVLLMLRGGRVVTEDPQERAADPTDHHH
jgi:DNA protecting protein DprA